ncbi:hypothetical protein AVEN_247486-1 [Araneus ventricosus]|uniref:Uncharacterized protein n=1 Tax=Araneus ventricosus TaxID=182803 RepID=A0A4Y2GVS3_ARAVE|nr:hypothetical protein AVEN_247486-1 [Araneus ventricosus]
MIGYPSYRSKNSIINSVFHYIILRKLLKNYDVRTEYKIQQATGTDRVAPFPWPILRLSSLMFELFTATTRETSDALTSLRATSNLPVAMTGNNAHHGRNLWVI